MPRGIVDELVQRSALGEPYQPLGLHVSCLPVLVQGIDYHWYHREDQWKHIGMLVHEVSELQETLEGAFDQALDDARQSRSHAPSLEITVYESGWSVLDALPPSLAGSSVTGEELQAREVVRRLGGALASEATVAGIHAWMDMSESGGSGFAGTGLRAYDPPTASHLLQVPSAQLSAWFVYRRLASLLGGGGWHTKYGDRVLSGKMLLPDTTSRAELVSRQAEHGIGAVVFEYRLASNPGGHRYAYLLLVDPGSSESAVDLEFWPAFGLTDIAEEFLEPRTRWVVVDGRLVPASYTVTGSVLPYMEMLFDAAVRHSLLDLLVWTGYGWGYGVRLDVRDWPRLWFTTAPLRFRVL